MKQMSKFIFTFVIATVGVSAALAKPDLIVSGAEIRGDASGLFVSNITVTITNGCRQSNAGPSYVLITFKQSEHAGAKSIYFVGNTVKALKGGESQSQTFDVSDKKIGLGRYVYIEADPYKKIVEANEDNNWRSLFPDRSGALTDQNQCLSER